MDVTGLGEAFTRHCDRDAEREERDAERDKKLDHVHEAIVGNGKVGLSERVRTLEQWVAGANKLTWLIITALVGLFLEFGCGMISAIYVTLAQAGRTP